MGAFLKLAKKRKTTYEFDEKNITNKTVLDFLEAARWAPSCTNSQPWNFVIVRDKLVIGKLMSLVNYGDFHTDPAVMIGIVLRAELCAGKGHACFRGKDSSVHDSYMSCGIAASYITLAATEAGVDSCILTPEQEQSKNLLKVKSEDAVPLLVGLGYQTKGTFQKKRERRPLKEIVSYGHFQGKAK